MKQAIMGYITALINVYNGDLKRIPKSSVTNSNIETFTNELNDLLDYVADIPDKQPITVALNDTEKVEILKKKISELEETCRFNNEIIEKQYKKIKKLQDGSHRWRILCEQLREKAAKLKGDNYTWQKRL